MPRPEKDYRKQVLKFGKNKKWHTISDVANYLGIHFYKARDTILQLEKENKIETDQKKAGFYWRRL